MESKKAEKDPKAEATPETDAECRQNEMKRTKWHVRTKPRADTGWREHAVQQPQIPRCRITEGPSTQAAASAQPAAHDVPTAIFPCSIPNSQ